MKTAITIISIIIIVATIVMITISFFRFRKMNLKGLLEESQKLLDENMENIEKMRKTIRDAGYDVDEVEKGKIVCKYCGGLVEQNIYKCPHCGAVKKD